MHDSVLPVVLTAEDATLEPGDWQWGEETRNLLRLLKSYDLDVRLRPLPPEAGDKGAPAEIILALGGSGMVGAATTVLLAWLNARSTRRVKLTIGEGDDRRTLELVGEGISDSSVRAALLAALGQPAIAPEGGSTPELQPADDQ